MVDISVIIPSNHDHHDLLEIVRAVCSQTAKPSEIVIVDSSVEGGACPAEIGVLCAECSIKLIYEHRERALPGDARNIGLRLASGELIAFIDVQTIPRSHWLEASLSLLAGHGVSGVWGATYFSAETKFERLVRGIFMAPGVTQEQVDFYVELFKKVRATPEWKKFMADGAFNQTFMTGKEFRNWLTLNEALHKQLMTEAGFLAK